MSVDQPQQAAPFMLVFKLTEGYVLDYGSYTVALTNPADLAKRVQDVAEQSEMGFQASIAPPLDPRTGQPSATPPTPELMEATAVPAAAPNGRTPGVVPTTSLDGEWTNVRQMIAFMAAGFDTNGKSFTRAEWDAALPMFAPHVDPKEAEFELSEFLSSLHED